MISLSSLHITLSREQLQYLTHLLPATYSPQPPQKDPVSVRLVKAIIDVAERDGLIINHAVRVDQFHLRHLCGYRMSSCE